MEKIVVKVDGMQCGMCEAHVNDIDDSKLKEVIDKTGYEIGTVTGEPYEKKGLFSAFRHEK